MGSAIGHAVEQRDLPRDAAVNQRDMVLDATLKQRCLPLDTHGPVCRGRSKERLSNCL